MQEEDYEVLRNEANANPEVYATWDPNRQFREQYHQRHMHDQTLAERERNIAAHERGERRASESQAPREEEATSVREEVEEVASPLSRHSTSSTSTTSSTSSASTHGARLEAYRSCYPSPDHTIAALLSYNVSINILHDHTP